VRCQGKITNWKDDQGFGFVTQNGTDKNKTAFVHIKAFSDRSRRPKLGDLITYEANLDEKRRFRADDVQFVIRASVKFSSSDVGGGSSTSSIGKALAYLFCAVLILSVLLGRLPLIVLGFYVVASFVAYVAYAMDKAAAESRRWRVAEDTLHIWGLIGGWPGALLAQQRLRHKTSKTSFQVMFWITVALNCAALGWLMTGSGTVFLAQFVGFNRF
jgi:uncharacterized membrane protein YsdA (DUF1294 family)/cold shock CspA family protein